jgi:hypothetical protein
MVRWNIKNKLAMKGTKKHHSRLPSRVLRIHEVKRFIALRALIQVNVDLDERLLIKVRDKNPFRPVPIATIQVKL